MCSETVLDTVATYKENIEAIKGKIKKAMFYPAMVVAVALIVSAILLVFVVPQFEEVFKGFGADLPAFTKLIVDAVSDFMVSWWWADPARRASASGVCLHYWPRSARWRFSRLLDRVDPEAAGARAR